MGDEELFERRFTHLGLARTLAADATIRDVQDAHAHDTVVANANHSELPQISIDLRHDGPLGAPRTPDLSIVSTIGEGGMGRVHLARQRSLDEHPSNVEASAGLRASVLALVDLELRQEHADTAEALLREVEGPDPSLASRVAAVRAREASRQREAQRLEAMDHDLDQTIEAFPRTILTGLLILLSASVSIVAVVTGSRSVSGAVAAPLFPAETAVIFSAATMVSFVLLGVPLWPKTSKA